MSKDIQSIKASRSEEYPAVAAKRRELLLGLDELHEFSTAEHYTASVLHLLENAEDYQMPLARLELVHPDRVMLNKVRKVLKKKGTIEEPKDGQTVMVKLKETPKAA